MTRQFFPVKVWTSRCYSDGSLYEGHQARENTTNVYAVATDRQEAEDTVRVWLSELSDTARVYTPEGKPKRRLVAVCGDPNSPPPIAKAPAGSMVIFNLHDNPDDEPLVPGQRFGNESDD